MKQQVWILMDRAEVYVYSNKEAAFENARRCGIDPERWVRIRDVDTEPVAS